MLLLKIFFTTYQPSPDKGGLTCYELISYHFVIIIGLQKYGFSLNWQTISSFLYIFPVAYSIESLLNTRYYSFH